MSASTELSMIGYALRSTAAQCECRQGHVAESYSRAMWNTYAELATGCHCEEAAETLLTSAWRWLAGEAAA